MSAEPQSPPSPGVSPPGMNRRAACATIAAGAALSLPGCVNFSSMFSKMFFGDPHIDASFKQQTGVRLNDKTSVIVYCTAPTTVLDRHPSLSFDLQKQLTQRMERRNIAVVDANRVSREIDNRGGRATPALIARLFEDVDYLVHVSVAAFDLEEPNSPNLLRGYAGGMLHGYALRGGQDSGGRQAVQIFQKEFQVEHPNHPVPRESMSPLAFEKKFLDVVSEQLGRVFYDFRSSELF
ncbi:MAG: hypothetical protein KF774_11025 [Planctomyces sp.]|nr:hypothetical protein [Planctomyces sp.]